MATVRIELDSDKQEARRIFEAFQKGRDHRPTLDAAIEEAWRQGRTPTGKARFVGLSEAEPVRLMVDVDVVSDTIH
ncbi:hypothetical protein [Arthrobacter castelli]|uniref:hypothetical protein n=1 Tax=Arthrobacter castelli TaxID=271431 RepID=UPI00041D2B96|nr:hypothetical protein [Arthrobacter castelli]